ncbi:hypothetical protein [Gaiella sp.]|uniref:hypothetical protein n=1 Tax=Gaiella sp. TaxID=2663207 RepID=UPI002E34B1CB|nr:hypothetical protein [Gaiella sp.]HEX5583170.1 hypothetical protein [Gaiella sp.]
MSAIAGAGITGGCGPSLYCPEQAVRRDQMASFLRRGLGRIAFDRSDQSNILIDETRVDLAVVTIQVGGAPGGTQFVKLDASVSLFMNSSTDCPCYGQYEITQDGGGSQSFLKSLRLDSGAPGNSDFADSSTTTVVAVPSGTTQTFRLQAFRFAPSPNDLRGFGEMSALVVPFGSSGTSSP